MTSAEFTRNRDNYCYRHPDRQSFVLCQRCLRTICPECQTQGAVGVICPECMAQQRADQTPAQKKASKRWSRSRSRVSAVTAERPTVTYVLAAITAAVFVVQLLTGGAIDSLLTFWAPALYPDITGAFQPWRLITGMFLHAGFWHIGLNMLALWMIGRILEPMLGHGRFLALYLISGVGGFVFVSLIAFSTPVVGASGAIFGLLGALLVIGRHIGADLTGILIVLGINLVIGFLPGFQISWQAHVGGLLAGALVGFIYARTRAPRHRGIQLALLVALCIGLLLLLLIPAVVYG